MTEKRRFRVETGLGVAHHFSAVDEEAAKERFKDSNTEVTKVEALEPKYAMYRSDLEWDEDHYMTFASWIDDAIQTNDIDEWISSWMDWQLRFYLRPEANMSYEPEEQDALIFDSAKEDYMFTQLGDGSPPGIGKLTYLSTELVETRLKSGAIEKTIKVSCSFENTLEEGTY